jgi:hypothetical protein
MRITLLGLLVVLGTFLLVVYAIEVHKRKDNGNDGTGHDQPHLPDDPGSQGKLPG